MYIVVVCLNILVCKMLKYVPEFKFAGKPLIECSIRLNDFGGDN